MEQTLTITETLSLSDASTARWDVVVIGAGVGGAIAAREAARMGHRVILVDQRHFPRRKVCGACLNGAALDVIDQVGLQRQVDEIGGPLLNRFSLHYGKRAVNLPLP